MMIIDRKGVTRIVILTKNYAIKLPRLNYGWMNFVQGVYCNLSERQCWNATKSEYLCPTLFSFLGFINIMPRVLVCKSEYEIDSIPNEEGEDRKTENYGRYEDRIVCVDYPYHRIKLYQRIGLDKDWYRIYVRTDNSMYVLTIIALIIILIFKL
jgi:hypothetical protein